MRKIETGRAGNQIYLTISNCFMRLRAQIKIWNMQEFWKKRKTRKCFWQCSCDFLGPLRNQYGTTHLILTIVSCASEHLSRFGYCFFFGFSVLVPVFIALCGFFSNFSIWFSVFVKNTYGLLDLVSDVVFGFSYLEIRFLLDLSGSFAKSVLFVYYSK